MSVAPNGEWKVSTRDARTARRLRAMMSESNKVMSERGEKVSAERTRETLRAPDGSTYRLAEHLVDRVKNKGFRPTRGISRPSFHMRRTADGGVLVSERGESGWTETRYTAEEWRAQKARPLWSRA